MRIDKIVMQTETVKEKDRIARKIDGQKGFKDKNFRLYHTEKESVL